MAQKDFRNIKKDYLLLLSERLPHGKNVYDFYNKVLTSMQHQMPHNSEEELFPLIKKAIIRILKNENSIDNIVNSIVFNR